MRSLLKSIVKQTVIPRGTRPYKIRAGALKGYRMLFDLRADTQVWRGVYEQALQHWLAHNVSPNSTCIDVGAAEGWATLIMAIHARNGQIHAFEPSDRGALIEQNLRLNDTLADRHVRIHTAYVGRTADAASPPDSPPTLSIDLFCAQEGISKVDVLKIDVDGPEASVLEGAAATIAGSRPAIAVEVHSRQLESEVLSLLSDYKYSSDIVLPPPHEHRPLEHNPMIFALPSE